MLIIGVSGGTASGKTTIVKEILKNFPPKDVIIISQDNYYHDYTHFSFEEREKINFDHPRAIDFDLWIQHINDLKKEKSIKQPIYSFITHSRTKEVVEIHPRPVIILEGILIFSDKRFRKLCDIKIFVQASADERLIRRIKRDMCDRGRDLDEVLTRYKDMVRPMHEEFVEPSKTYADIIIPNMRQNQVAINMLKSVVQDKIKSIL